MSEELNSNKRFYELQFDETVNDHYLLDVQPVDDVIGRLCPRPTLMIKIDSYTREIPEWRIESAEPDCID